MSDQGNGMQRAIGAQEATSELILQRMDRIEAKVDNLTATMHEFQGGKHAIFWVAGALGAIITILANWAISLAGHRSQT